MENKRTYPIKAVAVKTGLSIHVIRVWEKRYKAVNPTRTDTNRRLYTDKDIEKLILLKQATKEGHNIGSVAGMDTEALRDLVGGSYISNTKQAGEKKDISPALDECLQSIRNFDDQGLEKILLNASFQLSQAQLLDKLIIPLIFKVGELWHFGDIRIMHEHMATSVLKNFLSNMRNNYQVAENAPAVIVTTPLGQLHEMGALILSVVASAEGWRVTYLGPNLPADEIASAVAEKKARAVLLSIVYPADDQYLKRDIEKLGNLLADDVKVIVGGRMAKNYDMELHSIHAIVLEDFSDFKKVSTELKAR